jgi:hypothetical protein
MAHPRRVLYRVAQNSRIPNPEVGKDPVELEKKSPFLKKIQGDIESCTDILTTSYWLHVELRKNIKKILSKNKMTFIF